MDLNHFLRQRRPRWERLALLLDQVDRGGLAALGPRQAEELFSLYRLTSSDLNLVQTRTGNPSLVDFLEALVARAYAQLAVPPKANFFRAWWMIMRHYFPATLREQWRAVALSALALVMGTLVGMSATTADSDLASLFLPAEHLQQAPHERVADLEAMERSGHTRISSAGEHTAFTVFLFNNNIRVGVLAFALGLTFGIGTLIVLFYNGAMLGSLASLYFHDGVGKFFVAWVGPHGVIELPCVIIAGAAGLMLAARQIHRNEFSTMAKIRAARPKLVDLIVGSSTLLVLAGCIEGGFSQINEPTISYNFKIGVAATLGVALVVYLFVLPVKKRPEAAE